MRCYICDFSDSLPSLYQSSLVEPKGSRKRQVFVDPKTHREICSVCAHDVVKDSSKNIMDWKR